MKKNNSDYTDTAVVFLCESRRELLSEITVKNISDKPRSHTDMVSLWCESLCVSRDYSDLNNISDKTDTGMDSLLL